MVRAPLSVPVIRSTIEASNVKFDLSPAALIALKDSGVGDEVILMMQARTRGLAKGVATTAATRQGPEKSALLASSKDSDVILRNFRTMFVDASRAAYFGTAQMKAALGENKAFQSVKVSIVDDPGVADAVLTVDYTFAWDYPFVLKHQNTVWCCCRARASAHSRAPPGRTASQGSWRRPSNRTASNSRKGPPARYLRL